MPSALEFMHDRSVRDRGIKAEKAAMVSTIPAKVHLTELGLAKDRKGHKLSRQRHLEGSVVCCLLSLQTAC